ncbi:MAG: hypothetical protein K2K53_07840, partial [Oscillospiraceae bacterium]|nr:hypothetical protein [Oscillospiraceae bacterium]
RVLTWGANTYSQLGTALPGNAAYSATPVIVRTIDNQYLDNVVEISARNYHAVARSATWYTCPTGEETYLLTDLISQGTVDNSVDFDADGNVITKCPEDHVYYTSSPDYQTLTCKEHGQFNKNLTVSSNTVYVWGLNTNGQLGLNDTANRNRATESLVSKGGYATWFANYGTKAYGVSAGVSHTAILGDDGYVYSMGQGNLGTMGNGGTIQNNTNPVRSGAREDSLLIYLADEYDIGNDYSVDVANNAVTDISRAVAFYGSPYRLDTSRLALKEYTGLNMIHKDATLRNLTDVSSSTLTVTIMDPSLATYRWNGATLEFQAARGDKFGSTTVALDYNSNGLHYRYQFILYVK